MRYEVLDYAVVTLSENQAPVNAVIVDIGLGGLQLRTRKAIPVGEICRIQVGCGDSDPLVLRGEVRHSMMLEDSELVASGIRFVPQSHDERMAIAEFVHAIFQRQCDLLGG